MKMSMPFGSNGYCGPTVLSILSGKSTDECSLLASKDGKRLGPMYVHQLTYSLTALGINYLPYKTTLRIGRYDSKDYPYPTLKQWMREARRPSERDTPFILVITGHYILVKGDEVVDTLTHGQWVNINCYKRKTSHVRGFIKVLGESTQPEQEMAA